MGRLVYYLRKLCDITYSSDPGFFVVLLILVSIADLWKFLTTGLYYYSIVLFLFNFVWVSTISLLIGLFKHNFILSLFKWFILSLVFSQMCIDLFCWESDIPFNYHIAELLFATNINEIEEFFRSYVSTRLIIAISLGFMLCFFVKIYVQKFIKNSPIITSCCGIVFLVGVVSCMHYRGVWQDSIINRFMVYANTDYPRDLKKYLSHPKIQLCSEHNLPDNVIIIMGESFAKSHSSLYGYPKKTSPNFENLQDQGKLYVFNNVTSPKLITSQSFKCMLSTYKPEFGTSRPWYKCTTIPEVFGIMGYKTYWISNQIKTGLIDNVIGRYAELCDTLIFINENFTETQKLDGDLIPVVNHVKNGNTKQRKFFFIHLMGSHMVFSERYPNDYKKFSESDYMNFPENQRRILAEYDTSLAYNDSIVSSLFHIFDNQNSVIFYLSDHGLDIYESSNDYVGHGREGNIISEKAAYKIPFMIYTTKSFQNQYEDLIYRIKNNKEKPFRTDDLIYTLMDVVGAEFSDNNNVEEYSLIK